MSNQIPLADRDREFEMLLLREIAPLLSALLPVFASSLVFMLALKIDVTPIFAISNWSRKSFRCSS